MTEWNEDICITNISKSKSFLPFTSEQARGRDARMKMKRSIEARARCDQWSELTIHLKRMKPKDQNDVEIIIIGGFGIVVYLNRACGFWSDNNRRSKIASNRLKPQHFCYSTLYRPKNHNLTIVSFWIALWYLYEQPLLFDGKQWACIDEFFGLCV